MASRKGPDAPLLTSIAPPSSALSAAGASDAFASDPARAKSLKRSRETMPTSPDSESAGDMSPSKIARLVGYARQSPPPPPGAVAMEDERRGSEDGQRLHLATMTRLQDASPTTSNSVVDTAARALQPATIQPPVVPPAEMRDASPHSAASGGSGAAQVVESPAEMDVDGQNDRAYAPQPEAPMEDRLSTSLSYPGLPADASIPAPAPPHRGMSLPMGPSHHPDAAPRSPSSKKHKCPYCNTEFTRHHNLKSHLLTHSQEKPYVCEQCQMRFRRLHDLKRHGKLHTGEKPHVCPKCDRKFARGDALARHSKGAGGCAGRRASMGSFVGDESFERSSVDANASAMAGIIYESAADGDMAEEERRRQSLPSIKADHIASQPATDGYAPHARTYPPPGGRPAPSGGLFPPNVDRGTSSSNTSPSMPNSATSGHTPNTSISSMPMSAGSSSMYSQSGMTESPKPLSPAGILPNHDKRARSPGLNAQYPQQQFGPRQQDLSLASGLPQPPHGASQPNPAGTSAAAPTSQQSVAHRRTPSGTAQAPPNSSAAAGVDNANNLFASGEPGLWMYIQTMEDKVRQLTDEISAMKRTETQLMEKVATLEKNETTLTAEIVALRQQHSARQDDPQAQQ